MPSLELTKENINAVSLELARNKKALGESANYVMTFMFKSFPDKGELLGRIKVLNVGSKSARQIDSESDVMERVAMNVFSIKGVDNGSFMANMLAFFRDSSSFSRTFLIYFYSNSSLSPPKTDEALSEIVKLLLSETGLTEGFRRFLEEPEAFEHPSCEEAEESDTKSPEASVPEGDCDSSGSALSLVSLDDEDEIRRIDTSISMMFEETKRSLPPMSLTTCTKALDIMDIILKNNYPAEVDVIPALMYISGAGEPIFKRCLCVMRTVLKRTVYRDKERLFEMFCSLLERNASILRMALLVVKTCEQCFDWPRFLESVDLNKDADLSILDRSCIPSLQFYEFAMSVENPQRYAKTIRSMIRNETDTGLLMQLNEQVNDTKDMNIEWIKAAIHSRISALDHRDTPKKQKVPKDPGDN